MSGPERRMTEKLDESMKVQKDMEGFSLVTIPRFISTEIGHTEPGTASSACWCQDAKFSTEKGTPFGQTINVFTFQARSS